MNEYTDSASRGGQRNFTGDDRALFLTEFGGLVIEARNEALDYADLCWTKYITQGKSDLFSIIGKKRDAAEHTPGDLILGGKIEHADQEITVDKMLVDAVFIPEVDELLNHIEVRGPYSRQIGQSLGLVQTRRIAIMHILASRDTSDRVDQPLPSYAWDANMKTSASAIETGFFAAKQYKEENFITGYEWEGRLPWAQYLLCARNLGMQSTDVSLEKAGSGNRVAGTLGMIAGIPTRATNNIPKTNITTGPTKYQGNFSTTVGHIGSRMAVGKLQRKGLTMNMKEQAERLGFIIIGSELNGYGKLQVEESFELATAVRP
jgi:hypothetical protein